MKEPLFELASTLLPGIGNKLSKVLISYCGSAEAVFTEPLSKLRKTPGIGEKTIRILQNEREASLRRSEEIILASKNKGMEILHYTSKGYPYRLKQLEDAPPVLFIKGNHIHDQRKTVAIVGTRKATEYGKRITEQIVEDLKPHNPLIISGLAYGIDITAHKAALKNNLATVGILAGGLDKLYPSAHKEIAKKMLENGGLISENQPGTKPDMHFFPARNRIIAGMADVVIVVEAAAKGGALITADIAYSYEKTLMAVPGGLDSPYSAGCNTLIKTQKANIYTGVKDLEYLLHWENNGVAMQKPTLDLEAFSNTERPIIKTLLANREGILIDELSWKAQTSMNATASILLNLEFQGLVRSLPGKRFKLTV
ncbi:MAG: DNA-processing protein DprA [Cyclobacteriaceae bacterium]